MGQNAEDDQRSTEQLGLGDRTLILFIAVAVVAGGFTSTLVLNLFNRIWNENYLLFGITIVVNLLFALIVYRAFSRSYRQSFLERGLIVGMNIIGLIGGVWLFLT